MDCMTYFNYCMDSFIIAVIGPFIGLSVPESEFYLYL